MTGLNADEQSSWANSPGGFLFEMHDPDTSRIVWYWYDIKKTLWKGRPYHAGDMRYDVQSPARFQNSSLLNPF